MKLCTKYVYNLVLCPFVSTLVVYLLFEVNRFSRTVRKSLGGELHGLEVGIFVDLLLRLLGTFTMTPLQFVQKWEKSELKESSAAQSHFVDICSLIEHPPPRILTQLGIIIVSKKEQQNPPEGRDMQMYGRRVVLDGSIRGQKAI